MRTGFISQAAICGHTYVNKLFARAVDEPYILCTQGVKHQDTSEWENFDNVDFIQESLFELPHDVVLNWVKENKLDAVFFNEIEDWELVKKVREECKTIGYFVSDRVPERTENRYIENFDAILFCNEGAYESFAAFKNTHFLNWGVEPELFVKRDPQYFFTHSAGWGGVADRKCTPEVVRALSKVKEGAILYTQKCVYDGETTKRIRKMRTEGRLKVVYGNCERGDVNLFGEVYLGISRHEGLGLYLPEALAAGLPIITTDAPPMNQFVKHGETGLLVKVKESYYREGFSFPAYEPDFKDFLKQVKYAINNKEEMKKMGKNAYKFAKENYSYEKFKENFNNILETVVS